MRKQLRRKIAHVSQDRRAVETLQFRNRRREEVDVVESETFKRGARKTSQGKTVQEKDRVASLLNRGIATHFYKNLNKLAH